jgi:hypothetical protein
VAAPTGSPADRDRRPDRSHRPPGRTGWPVRTAAGAPRHRCRPRTGSSVRCRPARCPPRRRQPLE